MLYLDRQQENVVVELRDGDETLTATGADLEFAVEQRSEGAEAAPVVEPEAVEPAPEVEPVNEAPEAGDVLDLDAALGRLTVKAGSRDEEVRQAVLAYNRATGEAALRYAALGLRVVPLHSLGVEGGLHLRLGEEEEGRPLRQGVRALRRRRQAPARADLAARGHDRPRPGAPAAPSGSRRSASGSSAAPRPS